MDRLTAKKILKETAIDMGFSDVRFTKAEPLIESEKKMLEWREKGFAGDMQYLLREKPINARAEELFEGAKTIIIFTVNYFTIAPPRPSPDHARVASYAVGLDYHKVIKKKIKELVKKLETKDEFKDIFAKSKIFTDAVPLLEKSYAKKAGLGFKGKNTLLISRETGSFNFIAEIVTDIDFDTDSTESYASNGTCGNCTRCFDICPTNAFVEAHQIDARRCISYLSIETKGLIDQELMPDMGEWLFGCDLCQTICPYNRKQDPKDIETKWQEFRPESGVGHWLYLPALLCLDPIANQINQKLEENTKQEILDFYQINEIPELDEDKANEIFHERFCRTPLTRPKRKALIRNAIIAARNSAIESKSIDSTKFIKAYTQHQDPILKETANWALS